VSKPARPDLKFNCIDDLIADADQLRAGPYERAGQWDLAMILDHLAKSMGSPFKPGGKYFPWPARIIVQFAMGLFARRKMYPAIVIPAPEMIRPTPGIALEPAYAEFITTARQVQTAGGETIQVPPFGRLKLDDFRKIQLLHGAHHLSFLKRQ
jgi:hypothetical protein